MWCALLVGAVIGEFALLGQAVPVAPVLPRFGPKACLAVAPGLPFPGSTVRVGIFEGGFDE